MKLGRTGLVLAVFSFWLASSTAAELVFGTLNLRNYLLMDRWTGEAYRFDFPKPEDELERLREVIEDHPVHVLLLQEMGSLAFLEQLQADLAARGRSFPEAVFARQGDSRRGLAVLSTLPLESVILHTPQLPCGTHLFVRGVMEIRLRVSGTGIQLFNVHLKSRYSSDPSDPDAAGPRSREWAALRQLLDRLADPDKEVGLTLLSGDFNTPLAQAVASSWADPAWQWLPLADRLGEDWTYFFAKADQRECIDGFFALGPVPGKLVSGGLFPLSPPPWKGSDHRLVLLRWCPPPPKNPN
jgi:hypothetical protein